jgi:class 3 adenylate cyclase
VFKRPSGALAAGDPAEGRLTVMAGRWQVRLRIGIHTGRPTLPDGGYVLRGSSWTITKSSGSNGATDPLEFRCVT